MGGIHYIIYTTTKSIISQIPCDNAKIQHYTIYNTKTSSMSQILYDRSDYSIIDIQMVYWGGDSVNSPYQHGVHLCDTLN